MTIGELLKTIREQHEMNQTDFSNACMRTRDWLYLVETNSHRTKVTKQDLILLAESLNEPILKTLAIGLHYEEFSSAIKIF